MESWTRGRWGKQTAQTFLSGHSMRLLSLSASQSSLSPSPAFLGDLILSILAPALSSATLVPWSFSIFHKLVLAPSSLRTFFTAPRGTKKKILGRSFVKLKLLRSTLEIVLAARCDTPLGPADGLFATQMQFIYYVDYLLTLMSCVIDAFCRWCQLISSIIDVSLIINYIDLILMAACNRVIN